MEFSNIKLPYQLISNSSESQYIQKYENEILHLAISKLPQKQKERIILRFFYNLKLSEIASVEKVTVRAVERELKKAIHFLKNFLEKFNLN